MHSSPAWGGEVAPITTLTAPEITALLDKIYADSRPPYDKSLMDLKSPAGQFCRAWFECIGNATNSMIWALNNEALPYRHVLIAHLVSIHLHDTP